MDDLFGFSQFFSKNSDLGTDGNGGVNISGFQRKMQMKLRVLGEATTKMLPFLIGDVYD